MENATIRHGWPHRPADLCESRKLQATATLPARGVQAHYILANSRHSARHQHAGQRGCCLQTVFEADPQHWQSGTIRSRMGDPSSLARLPFMRARVQNIEMDLGVLEKSGATYMQFNAGGAACDDLRLAYSKIMTEYEIYSEDAVSDLPQVSCPDPSPRPRSRKVLAVAGRGCCSVLLQLGSERAACVPVRVCWTPWVAGSARGMASGWVLDSSTAIVPVRDSQAWLRGRPEAPCLSLT